MKNLTIEQAQVLREEDLNYDLLFPVVSNRESYEALLATMSLSMRDAINAVVKLAWLNGMAEAFSLQKKILNKEAL